MIGYIKGYDVCNVTNRKLEKKDFLCELEQKDSKIKNKILECIATNGFVVGLRKKNNLKVVYIFNLEAETKVLKFSEMLKTDEVEEKSIEDFEKAIIEELKEGLIFEKYKKVDWNDIEIVPNEGKGFSSLTFSTCIALGLLYGVAFHNIGLGLLFGMAIGLCFGAIVKKKDKGE